MSGLKYSKLTPEKGKKIEQYLVSIFKDVYYNNPNIIRAKEESGLISDEIRRFILDFTSSQENVTEVDLLVKAKEKGQELVESHELVFFEEKIDKKLTMRAFLIPSMRVEFTDEGATEMVTEDDLQTLDHELCISFKSVEVNEFTKLGNLLDIRATLAKALVNKGEEQKEVIGLIKENERFKNALEDALSSANRVLSSNG